MAANKYLPEPEVFTAKQRILNKLCKVYLRFKKNEWVDAEELRRELNISEAVFADALFGFLSVEKQMAVEVLDGKGRIYLRLGEIGQDLCSDWNVKKKPVAARKIEPPLDIQLGDSIRRSA